MHTNINNSIGYVKWRNCQSEFDILLKQYFIDKENLVLNSNNKSLIYKYLNDKLHTYNSISPLLCSIANNIVTSDDEKAVFFANLALYLLITIVLVLIFLL